MSTLRIYLWDKKEQLKRELVNGGHSLGKARTWWNIYAVLLVYFFMEYFITYSMFWLQLVMISFLVLAFITFWMDYSSGRHVGNWRKERERKWKEQQQIQQQGSQE